jgi:predicted enzyme related to lactoylglutathione lyase
MARVIHFEIPADDPDRPIAFYKSAFGWKVEKWSVPMDYWMIGTGDEKTPGINGAILKRGDVKCTTNTVDVKSLEGSLAAVTKAGGTLIMPKTAIPGVGYFAYCLDPEGNLFGMLEADAKAK